MEPQNLKRQNFYPEDVGHYKSIVLAERFTVKYNRPIAYATVPIGDFELRNRSVLLMGCVDTGTARQDIQSFFNNRYGWWVDGGNGENFGQVLIGNGKTALFIEDKQSVNRLPLPSIQRPEILLQAPPEPGLACEEGEIQGPTINQAMAALMTEVARRIFNGNCPWVQLLLDMQTGTLSPVMAEPEILRKIMKTRSKEKVEVRNSNGTQAGS